MKPPQPPPFARALIFNVGGLVLALGLALLIAMVWQGVASTEAAARQEITETLNRGVERLRILSRAAEMTQESAERIARTAGVSGSSLRAVLETSLAAFEQRPELSYLGIALAETGEYGCLERTPDGAILLWLFPGTRTDVTVRRNFILTDKGFVLHEERPADGYDPRKRFFYQAALDGPAEGTWIPSYEWIVHAAGSDPLWGFSYVKAIRDGAGRPVGVLDTDFDMLALNSFLRSVATEYGCKLQIVELGDSPRLIGDPAATRVPLPLPAGFAALTGFSGESFVGRMELAGERQWVAARRLTLKGGVPWLVVASRQDVLIGAPLRRQLYQVIGMGLVLVAGLMLVSARVARRFGRPLAELEQRVAGFGQGGPGPLAAAAPAATKGFRETQHLDEAFRSMAVAVRQREQELSKQNSRLRSHLENTPLAVIEWDDQARITNVNAAAVGLFRREAAAMIGQPVLQLVAAGDRSRVAVFFDPARPASDQKQFSAKGSTAGGVGPDCEWYVTKLEPGNTGQAGGCALVLDVSQLLEAEAAKALLEARQSRQRDALISHTSRKGPDDDLPAALKRITESSARTLDSARVSVWRYNTDQTALECRNLFELAAGRHSDGLRLAAADFPVYFRALANGEVLAADDACADPRTRDFTENYFRPLGIGALLDVPIYVGRTVVGVLCHEHVGGPRAWTSDEKTFAMAMANLVSLSVEGEERRVLQEQFLRAQRMEAVGTLASGLAHDLNNILAPMLMAAGLLKMRLTAPRDQNIVAMIETGAQRGAGIIKQLLTFGRGTQGARTLVQLRHLIKDIAQIVAETFPRNIEFEHVAPNTLWPVLADATQLHQVLLNLSVNARDAMPQGGKLAMAVENEEFTEETAKAHVPAKAGRYIKLTVTDTGEGIPRAIIDRIFDPFFTTKPVGKGTGLGLSSVLGIVKNHGGFLRVESEPGRGTTFEIHLPAAEEPAEKAAAGTTDQLPRGAGQLVLVVDDEKAMREATREMLELHNYRVIMAANGEEAVKRFVENRDAVQLVLTDVDMPVMGGPELIRSLRVAEPNLKVVVLAGSMSEAHQAELKDLGLAHILEKPCDAGRLLGTLQQALGQGG